MSAAAVAVIVSPEHKVLCVTNRHYQGFGLPGGKVEKDEHPRFACEREVEEEVGLTLLDTRQIHKAPSCTNHDRMVYVYWVAYAVGTVRAVEEGTEVKWMSLDELIECSPFAAFYGSAFPDGIEHLMPSRLEGA